MIKIDSNSTRDRKGGYATTCAIDIDGNKLQIACELVGILSAMEEKQPEIFSQALDMFLREKGF